jgi:hypothetical protein
MTFERMSRRLLASTLPVFLSLGCSELVLRVRDPSQVRIQDPNPPHDYLGKAGKLTGLDEPEFGINCFSDIARLSSAGRAFGTPEDLGQFLAEGRRNRPAEGLNLTCTYEDLVARMNGEMRTQDILFKTSAGNIENLARRKSIGRPTGMVLIFLGAFPALIGTGLGFWEE